METPTVVPAVTITLGGETHSLRLGFRAMKELGINPFQKAVAKNGDAPRTQLEEFIDGMDVERAATFVRACLLHEYAKTGSRYGQDPPTADDILDLLDLELFEGTLAKIFQASGLLSDTPGESRADPQTA